MNKQLVTLLLLATCACVRTAETLAAGASGLGAQLPIRGEAELAQTRSKAERGDAQAQEQLGFELDYGSLTGPTTAAEAVTWYRKAAEQGLAGAQCNLGNCYENGRGVDKDMTQAVKRYRQAAEQGLAIAQYNLGLCYYWGRGVAEDAKEAVAWFRKAAAQDHSQAQNYMGVCYENGQGVDQDLAEGVAWYRKAAGQKEAAALYNLGNCYKRGRGVPPDDAEAVKCYRQAAALNYALAQYNLGLSYAKGLGVKKDLVEAYTWMLLAAAQGDASAQPNIMVLEHLLTSEQQAEGQDRARQLTAEEGPTPPVQQALSPDGAVFDVPFRLSTSDPKALNEQGENLLATRGGPMEAGVVAARCFREAAILDYAAAQRNLGLCYERGMGVAKHYVEAYKWYCLAAEQKDEKASRSRLLLELLLSPAQQAQGQQRVRAWREKHPAPTPATVEPSKGGAQ